MNDSFCRRCNMDLIGEDNMKVGEYSFCMSCMVQNEKDKLKSFKNKLTGIVNQFFFEHPIVYDEYGAGARLINSGGLLIADFEDHIDAETFMELIDEIRNWSTDLRGEETKESQDKEVEKVE